MAVDQEPTRSQHTNRLIALCKEVASGETDAQDLHRYLDERRSGLEAARSDFVSRAQKEGEAFNVAFRQDIEAVLETFAAYGRAMDEIGHFFDDHDPRHLVTGAQALVEVTPELLAALENYESKFVVAGPTQFPMLNILLRYVPEVKAGRIPGDELKTMLQGAAETFSKALADLEASPQKSDPGIPERISAFQRLVEGLTTMQRYFADADAGNLDRGLEIVEEAHHLIAEALQKYQQATFTGGPTSSPMANWVIAAARGVEEGKYPPQILREAVEWMQGETRKVRMGFEQTASSPTTSTAIQDELPRTLEAFDLLDEALARLHSVSESGSREALDRGLADLQGAVLRLHESQSTYNQIGEREGKVVCPQCQRANAPGNRRCEQCGMTLPRVMDEAYSAGALSTFELRESQPGPGAEDEMVMTTNLQRLFQAAEAVHARQIQDEEFMEIVDWAEGLLEEGEQQMSALPTLDTQTDVPDEERAAFEEQKRLAEETTALLARGIEEFRAGLGLMRDFLDSRDQAVMVQGIRSVWDGARKIHQCQRMGEMVAGLDEGEEGASPRRTDEVELQEETE